MMEQMFQLIVGQQVIINDSVMVWCSLGVIAFLAALTWIAWRTRPRDIDNTTEMEEKDDD